MRRTKIVCTLGPAVDGVENLSLLAAAGMDVARLNFSHGTHADHEARIRDVRTVSCDTGRCIAILQDLCGPKIRVGNVASGTRLRKDARFVLTTREVPGDEDSVHLPVPEMVAAVDRGCRLLLDDGLLELEVLEKTTTDLVTRVLVGGILGSKKGISAPGITLPIEAVTDKDESDVAFGLRMGVDYVALSFVRSEQDVFRLRDIMRASAGRTVPVIVKIEKFEAVQNLDAILDAADGAMVARGDLGVEMPIEDIPLVQKKIIRACNKRGKPVITATQMLDSMIRNPRPTRAEVTDIANAVFDGTDALMLSGETAVGAYPTEAVQMMAKVADGAESELDYARLLDEKQAQHGTRNVTDAIGEAVATVAHDLSVAAILCSTTSGGTAQAVSKFKPRAPILAATTREETYRQMALLWGVHPMLVPFPGDTDAMIAQTIDAAVARGLIRNGDLVVMTAGTPIGVPGSTNLIKVHTVGQAVSEPPDGSRLDPGGGAAGAAGR
jgi:pyruvate kinase